LVVHQNNDKELHENSQPLRKLVYEAFQRHFPTMVAVMEDIKGGHYKNMAHQMQRAESQLIFNGSSTEFVGKNRAG